MTVIRNLHYCFVFTDIIRMNKNELALINEFNLKDILCSFYYIYYCKPDIMRKHYPDVEYSNNNIPVNILELIRQRYPSIQFLIIDSGAFTLFQQQEKNKDIKIKPYTVDEYIEFILNNYNYADIFIQLDTIGFDKNTVIGTLNNFQYMYDKLEELGGKSYNTKLMAVLRAVNPSLLKHMLDYYTDKSRFPNLKYIGIPLSKAKRCNKIPFIEYMRMFTNSHKEYWWHGLDIGTIERIIKSGLYLNSVDSTTYQKTPAYFGYTYYKSKNFKKLTPRPYKPSEYMSFHNDKLIRRGLAGEKKLIRIKMEILSIIQQLQYYKLI